MADTDYRLLLQKYMMFVGENEGTDFVFSNDWPPPSYFTDREWRELKQASVDSCEMEAAIAKARKQNGE